MLDTLITIAKVLIMLSFLIVGLYIVDIAETRFIYELSRRYNLHYRFNICNVLITIINDIF